ncbi:MAG: hypothetical protein QM796_21450 [Chthoniobacteraceae bacterium]
MKTAYLLPLIAAFGSVGTASAAWLRLPYAEARVINVAASAYPGTKVIASSGISEAESLLADDPSKMAALATGAGRVTLQLPSQRLIESTSFLNGGAEGTVTISGSSDHKDWINLGQASFVSTDRYIQLQFAGAQIKYLQLAFATAQGGKISSLTIAAAAKGPVTPVANPGQSGSGSDDKTVTVNSSSGVTGGKAIYAYPTPTNIGEPDAELNVFKFPNSGDKYRTIIYDLGLPREIKAFSTSYTARPTRIEVFAFSELPEKKDWRGKVTLDPIVFDQTSPIAVGEDARGTGTIKIVPSKPVKAKYLAMRFEPNYLRGTAANSASWSEYVADNFGFSGAQMIAADDGGFTTFSVSLPASVSLQSLINTLTSLFPDSTVVTNPDGTTTTTISGTPTDELTAQSAVSALGALLGSSIFSQYGFDGRSSGGVGSVTR